MGPLRLTICVLIKTLPLIFWKSAVFWSLVAVWMSHWRCRCCFATWGAITCTALTCWPAYQRLPSQRYPDCLQYVHGGTGVNRCIYTVLTWVSLPVKSDVTYMFVCSSYVCFEIRGSVYQHRLRNSRSRVQRKLGSGAVPMRTSKRTQTVQLRRLKPNIYFLGMYN